MVSMATVTEEEQRKDNGEEQQEDGGKEEEKYLRSSLPSVSAEELRKHATPGDLWISIQGKVYDVTQWVPQHPGGNLPILHLAGQDVTDAFLAFHPPSAYPLLDRYLVARLSDYRVSPASRDFRILLSRISSLGLFRRPGSLGLCTLLSVAVLLSLSLYFLLARDGVLAHLASAAALGLAWIQSGWLGHDSGHYRIVSSAGPRLNRVVQVLAGNCLSGISIAWWTRNHNAHHFSCNSLDYDPDLQHIPLFAVSSEIFRSLTSKFYGRVIRFDALSRLLVSYQHLTFYPIMCVARVNLFLQSVVLLFSAKHVPDRWVEIAGVAVFWVWYPMLVSCMPTWWERAAFVLVSFAVTGIQHVQFCLNHFSSEVYVGKPTADDWFEKQTRGTLNIDCVPWMDWFHGGLQFQLEHHLFPRLPRCHLRAVAPLVRELCKKHGLHYACATFAEANLMTLQTLRAAAMEARNLVWEAVNTHG